MTRLLILLAVPVLLSGCTVMHVAGDVAEGVVNVTGAVVGGAADVVTTSDEEKFKKAQKEEQSGS